MRSNIVNVLVFVVLAVGLWFGLSYAEKHWFPQPAKKDTFAKLREAQEKLLEEQAQKAAKDLELKQVQESKKNAAAAVTGWPPAAVDPGGKPAVAKPAGPPKPPAPPRPRANLIPLGGAGYNLQVMLNTRGGAVQQVILAKFEAADRLGREVKEKDAGGTPTGKDEPLYLIPGKPIYRGKFLDEPYIPPVLKPGPVDELTVLAEPSYAVYHYATREDKYPDPFLGETDWKVVSESRPEVGEHTVVLEAELGDPHQVKFRKTYTLAPGDYHVGFKLEIVRLPAGQKGKGLLRYQVSGPRGLPLEGEWYTGTFRTALVGWADPKGGLGRQVEDAASVALRRGSDAVMKGENTFKYMAISTQYFASGLAVDDTAEGSAKNPWAYVRATTEVPENPLPNDNLNFEDLTVRAASEVLDLGPGQSVVHSYIIYNGPAKVRLLGLMEGDRAVDPALVERYLDKLDLRTLTDFHSPSSLGSFANSIWWSDIVITFTNLMHWLLAGIHGVIGNWAVSIIVLTVMVRLLLLYPSRKQTQMNLRMVEVQKRIAPQLEELKKKYGDDASGFNQEKMRLMMRNGINPVAPLGGCLLLIFQMPVMMGLYFCLQESIFFRLDRFLWIDNLAAPDMTLWWGEKIPYISAPENLGSTFYLGPYLNILPLIAVALMLWQQHKMMPPPTDEQTAQQQKMMKFMMLFMAVMFYKVASGLALYFIVGTLWGIMERRFFTKAPRKDDELGGEPTANLPPQSAYPNGKYEPDPDKPKGALGRFKDAVQKRMEELQKQAEEQSRRQIRNDTDPKRDRKKKRRK